MGSFEALQDLLLPTVINSVLVNSCQDPGPVLFHRHISFNPQTTANKYYYLFLLEEETEAQKGAETCPASQSL